LNDRNSDEQKVITVKDFAEEVKLSTYYITRCIRRGEIKASKGKGRRKWLIPKGEIDRFKGKKPQTDKPMPTVGESYPITTQLQHHFDQLLKVAEALLNGLDKLTQTEEGDYLYYENDNIKVSLYDHELVQELQDNLRHARRDFRALGLFDCFMSHLQAEHPQIQDIGQYINTSAFTLVQILQEFCLEGTTFKGKCHICKDWQKGR